MYRAAPALILILLAGCSATTTPIAVTRFAAAPDVARAPAAPAPGSAPTLEQKSFEDAVGRELARIGFGSDGAPRYSYRVDVSRETRAAPPRQSPVTIGIGGGTGGLGGGIGLGTSFGIGGNRSRDTLVTRLSVQLREQATGKVVWEGRAEGEATTPDAASVDRLAAALFKDFPGESGRTVSVP